MTTRTNFLRHEAYDGLSGEGASTTNQKKASIARAVAGTAVQFGPFAQGDYELTAVDAADISGTTTKADNLVYKFNQTSGASVDAAEDHFWLASNNLPKHITITTDYPYISMIRASGSAKTMRVSIARVKGRS